jgi:hypothetical protein
LVTGGHGNPTGGIVVPRLKTERSRYYFEPESIESRVPVPRQLEKLTLVAGVPFTKPTMEKLADIRKQLQKSVGELLCYFIEPNNLGTELLLLDGNPDRATPLMLDGVTRRCTAASAALSEFEPFNIEYSDLILNNEGVFILKSAVPNPTVEAVRAAVKRKFMVQKLSMPLLQVWWTQIPLGRVLEAPPENLLKQLAGGLAFDPILEPVEHISIIHETRSYMAAKEILRVIDLAN